MVVTMSLLTVFVAASVIITANVDHTSAQGLSNDVGETDDVQPGLASPSQSANPLLALLTRSSGHRLNSQAMANVREAISSGNFDRFTPAPVTDPNCYVEVEVKRIERVPGRCITLGSGTRGCQADKWLSLTSRECL